MREPEMTDQMSAYDLKRAFESIVQIAETIPNRMSTILDEGVEAGIQDTLSKMSRVMDTIHTFEETLDKKQEELVERADAFYKSVREKYTEVNNKFESLTSLPENLKVPYGVVQIIEIAERCSKLTDTQWDRVVELSKALNEGRN
jgi:Sec7-like guanine-nucleotide exchange factor